MAYISQYQSRGSDLLLELRFLPLLLVDLFAPLLLLLDLPLPLDREEEE